jgi:hypothetical protein
VTGTRDFAQFYHRRMNALWLFTAPHHETIDLDLDHGTARIADTLEFHMKAFAKPLPSPTTWSHADVYPFFDIWDWSVASNRRRPGFTALDNVSKTGFRASVREWLPSGPTLPKVKLSVMTGKLYPPRSTQTVTFVRVRDGKLHRAPVRADAEGRLAIELDGEEYEVGVSDTGVLALNGFRNDVEPWATVRKPSHIRARFWNKGAVPMAAQSIRWESPNPSVVIAEPTVRLAAIMPGASAEAPLAFTVFDESREVVRVFAVAGGQKMPLDIPVFPQVEASTDFKVADAKTYKVYQNATKLEESMLGSGNGDGLANPGESIAILLPDGDGFRPAEIFSTDSCIESIARESDSWAAYDGAGSSVKYSLPLIRRDCAPGHVIRAIARVQLPDKPNHRLRYFAISLPVAPATK